MRGSVLLLAVVMALAGCSRGETESQMRERVQRQERQRQRQQRQQRLARERERAERLRLEQQRRGLDAVRRPRPAMGMDDSMAAQASDPAAAVKKRESPAAADGSARVPPRRPMRATMSAPRAYKVARPAPRRRLKRPRRRRSPSLEGLFE